MLHVPAGTGNSTRLPIVVETQAVANLTVEATVLGLSIHQMGGFDPQLARELFAILEGYEPAVVLALGYAGESVGEPSARTRKPLTDFVFSGKWGTAAAL